MRRVLAVALIAALTTMMLGIERTSWASQERDQAKQQAEVRKVLGELKRGSTATIERQDGRKTDVVIEEITVDSVTVMRQEKDHVVTETIPISDIAKIKKISVKKMSKTSKLAIGTAVAVGVIVAAALAACASAAYSDHPAALETAH
jgi:hypothetical protein